MSQPSHLPSHREFLTLVEAPTVASPGTGSVTTRTDNAADRQRFAGLIEMDRAEIVSAYRSTLETSGSLVIDDPIYLSRAIMQGSEIVTDVVESVRADAVLADRRHKLQPCVLGEKPAANTLSQQDSLRADATLFDAVVTSVTRHVAGSPELLPWFGVAVRALNESISRRLSEAAVAQHEYLLSRVHHAQLNERHRIARELHDRIGEGLSVALRQLELHELVGADEPVRAAAANAMARDAITEGMRRLRTVTSDLRQHDPVANLENALAAYLGSVEADDVVLRMRVSGDETWATHTVLDESFLILREAIRNALTHGDPAMVLIAVEITSHELQAWVEDDGRGFDSSQDQGSGRGSGLTSIRERTALLNGTISVSSRPGHGTRVEFLLPLPGPLDGPSA
jgi:signal transduction histidine kinase